MFNSNQQVIQQSSREQTQMLRGGPSTASPQNFKVSILCTAVVHLADNGLKHCTIKAYLSAVRLMHIAEVFSAPSEPHLNHLQYTLQGIKRSEAENGGENRERLPIGPNTLRCIKAVWDQESSDLDAMGSTLFSFFGFLRAGEFTVLADNSFDSEVHLCFNDIAVDNPAQPKVVQITIKQTKTELFRKGVKLYLGKT